MILVVGGEGSGKRTFIESLGYTESDIADATLDERPVLVHLERFVNRAVRDAVDTNSGFAVDSGIAEELADQLAGREVVACNEVGSGIVPVERGEMAMREVTGRLCILLAQNADAVIRMVCGIPQVIKGSLK